MAVLLCAFWWGELQNPAGALMHVAKSGGLEEYRRSSEMNVMRVSMQGEQKVATTEENTDAVMVLHI